MPQPILIPKAYEPLRFPAQYKVFHHGRDAACTWSFVREALKQGYISPLRFLCTREIQKSIKDSVHKTLSDQIDKLGMSDHYRVTDNAITGKNGTEFLFEGLRHNIDNVRSKEGIDRCLVFEASNVSKSSWDVLLPTVIRKPGSEVWVEYNPILETDDTHKRWVLNPMPGSIVKHTTFKDNPFLSAESRRYIEHMRDTKPDDYLHIYEGNCKLTLEGAIYAAELRAARLEGRITRVPYDPRLPVQAFWDLGWADHTSIWFVQRVGFEYRVIDCYQNRLQKTPFYISVLQQRGYQYSHLFLPHDGDHEHMNSESIKKTVVRAFPNAKTDVVPRVPRKELEFEAVREIFPMCWFDQEHCADGIQAISHYQYEIDDRGQWSRTPLHDENSHYADAFATFARSVSRKHEVKQVNEIKVVSYSKDEASAAWMG